jgi:hypothetical protein
MVRTRVATDGPAASGECTFYFSVVIINLPKAADVPFGDGSKVALAVSPEKASKLRTFARID